MALLTPYAHSDGLSISQFKRRMLMVVFGLTIVLAAIPLTPKYDPLSQSSLEKRRTVNLIEIAIDSSCSPFGTLLPCARVNSSRTTS